MGGAGFLGSHLCDAILAQGGSAVAVDNLVTGDLRNIAHLREKPNFEFMQHDVTVPFDVKGQVDYVLNMASPASPFDYARLPIETLRVGSLGTEHGLQLALAKKAVFLQASTSEIYGDPTVHPQPESYWGNVNSIGPRSCYDEAKRYGEAIVMAYHRTHGVKTRMVRIFNTYGPRMRTEDGRVVPAFVSQALRNEDFTIFGDGSQTRSFCYVDDEVRGILLLAQSDVAEPVNIGNPNEFTMLQLAEVARKVTGCTSKTSFKPLPKDDPKQRKPDITRAKQLLGWEPQIQLEEGLKRTVAWFKTQV
ncbi:MAG: SDR family oxidoreductase [Deltaproteobacteria bacterium]|nr:SDR family oxidoreductase [Deltaproteobacteria bacterium]